MMRGVPEQPKAGAKKKKRWPLFLALGIVVALVLAVGGFFGFNIIRDQMQYQTALQDALDLMEKGRYSKAQACFQDALELRPDSEEASNGLRDAQYYDALEEAADALEDGDYEQAMEYYKDALEILPVGEEAKEGLNQTVMAQAKQYLQQENFGQAADLLEGLQIDDGSEDYAQYSDLLTVAKMDPSIVDINVDSYPTVTITLSCGSELSADQVVLTEDGVERDLQDFKKEGDNIVFSYEGDDVGYESVHRELTVTLKEGDYTFQRDSSYDTPYFEPAVVQMVSSDVSAYPIIRTYFRVTRWEDGSTVQGLDANSFQIKECVDGGEYLAREIHSVSQMEDLGLNIDLVADKSDSISYDDMNLIKDVMIEFVNNLHYDVGDKAEVLAFDDIVQQMCWFTDDPTLLINGINNMSTDGLTAFYDAVYSGIQNASLQGGARCVIAFTDGMDNRSIHSSWDVINYANTNQVPVYIIGVGYSVEEQTLRDIAEATGGRYWFISDLYDLQSIFEQVYAEQKELYMVEYVSEEGIDQYAGRELEVSVSGGGARGDTAVYFTPAYSVQGVTHAFRYELVQGTYTWEEANRRCQEMGGHLATITSQDEMDQIIALAEENDCKYIWLGGYTSYDYDGHVFGHWVTGEDFSFQAWGDGQPSRQDLDGTPEWYIMLWYVHNKWMWNDQRDDPASVSAALNQNMCFICEYEE